MAVDMLPAFDSVLLRMRSPQDARLRCSKPAGDMNEEGLEFELVAASLRADLSDSKAFLAALAIKLGGALPEQTSVRQHGGLFGKKGIQAIDVDLGEQRFHIEEAGGRLTATCQKTVRGIVLKNENLQVDQWIAELSRQVSAEAQRTETGRAALERMLEQG
jgi:peptidyl-tRNA hydrolase